MDLNDKVVLYILVGQLYGSGFIYCFLLRLNYATPATLSPLLHPNAACIENRYNIQLTKIPAMQHF